MEQDCEHNEITIIVDKKTYEYKSIKCNKCDCIFLLDEFKKRNFNEITVVEK